MSTSKTVFSDTSVKVPGSAAPGQHRIQYLHDAVPLTDMHVVHLNISGHDAHNVNVKATGPIASQVNLC